MPPVAAVLRTLGASVPIGMLRTGLPATARPTGWVEPTPFLVDWAAELGTG